MGTADWYAENHIDLRLSEQVTGIDRANQTITTPMGDYAYDELVLATGSYPFVPPIKGNEHPHCLVYRTLEDLDSIRASADGVKTGVVVGGGLLGLERSLLPI